MSESNFEVFDPRTLVIDSPEDGCDHGDFGFAFNNSNFSDRVLRVYIFSEPIESTSSPSGIAVFFPLNDFLMLSIFRRG